MEICVVGRQLLNNQKHVPQQVNSVSDRQANWKSSHYALFETLLERSSPADS